MQQQRSPASISSNDGNRSAIVDVVYVGMKLGERDQGQRHWFAYKCLVASSIVDMCDGQELSWHAPSHV